MPATLDDQFGFVPDGSATAAAPQANGLPKTDFGFVPDSDAVVKDDSAKPPPTLGDLINSSPTGRALVRAGQAVNQQVIAPTLSTATRLAEAIPGDVMAKVAGAPQFGGNIDAALTGPQYVPPKFNAIVDPATGRVISGSNEPAQHLPPPELPINKAVQDAAEEAKFRGEFPWAALGAKTSLGVFGAAPKIAAMAALPESLPVQMAAGGVLFSVDDNGQFHPAEVPFNALLPGVGRAARVATGAAIGAAISKGATALESPVAQKVLEEIGDQAGMNAFMAAQQSPELMKLYKEDRQAFYQQMAGMVGQNLAMRLGLGAVHEFSPDVASQTRNFIEGNADLFTQRTLARLAGGDLSRQLRTGPMETPGPANPIPQPDLAGSSFFNQVPQQPQKIDLGKVAVPPANGEQVPEKSEQVPAAGASQAAPPPRMPGRDMLQQLRQESGTIVPEQPQDTAQMHSIPGSPLTAGPIGETTVPGAVEGTVTGQKEGKASEVPAATTSAAGPMPAEAVQPGEQSPEAAALKPRPPSQAPPARGITDEDGLLHDIVASGGKIPIFMPDGITLANWRRLNKKGWDTMSPKERDLYQRIQAKIPQDWEDNFGVDGAQARAAYDAAKRAGIANELFAPTTDGSKLGFDNLMDFVRQAKGQDYKPGDLWHDVTSLANAHAERKEGVFQQNNFQAKVVRGERAKSDKAGVEQYRSGDLREGDSFTVQKNTFQVRDHYRDETGTPITTVEDGPKFGKQTLYGDEPLHIDKGSFQAGAEHGEGAPQPAPPAVPENKTIGGSTSGKPMALESGEDFSLRETATPSRLDALAQDVHGKPYAELEDWQQKAIRQAVERGTLPRRQQPAGAAGREPVDQGEPAGEGAPAERAAGPVRPAGAEADPIQERLNDLERERDRLTSELNKAPRDVNGSPQERLGIGTLAQLRHTEGQIDILRDISNAPADLKAKWFQKFLEGDAPDAVERTLDKLIGATDPLRPLRKGELQMGFPKWATQTVINSALKIVRAAYTGGKRLAEAIQEGVKYLRAQNLPGFDADEAHVFLLKSMQEPEGGSATGQQGQKSYSNIQARRDEIAKRLNEIGSIERRPGNKLAPELRSERYKLAKESRDLQKQLSTNPDYVRDVYRRMDKLTNDLQIANKAGNNLHAREIVDELKSIMEGELPNIPQDLQKRIYDELVAKGEIMKSQMKELPAGRTMGELTAWLKANGADSPKLSLLDRLNLARRLADTWNKGKDAFTNAWAKVQAGWEAFKAQYKAPPKDDDFRSLMKDWFYEKQWTGLETHKWVQEIRRQVPQPVRRGALSVWLDAGGDEHVLRSQAEMVPARYKPFWDAALKLTPGEQQLARRIQLDFEQKLSDGQGLGLIDRGRADYGVPQLWKVKPQHEGEYDPEDPQWKRPRTPRNPTARLDPRDPFFALERSTPSYFDGIMAGGHPRSMDIGDLVGVYNTDFHNALADRGVIKSLKDAKAADGKPVVMISGAARIDPGAQGGRTYFTDSSWRPKDAVTADGRPYQAIDHWALKDWKFASTTEDGNPILVHGDFLVHPDHFRFLKNELGQSWLRDPEGGGRILNPILNSTAFLKASKFASATFHMATLAEHSMFHAAAGAPSAERASLLWPSTRGVELDPGKNPELANLMRNGMELGFGSQRELFEEGLSGHGGIWGKVPGLGDAMTRLSDFMFKRYMPALKTKTATVMLHANQERYQGKLSPEQIYELTANQANAAFGAQNWKMMGTNKTWLDVNRLLFTAPDFLLSRAKVVGQALKPFGAEQRHFILAQAALVYGAARVLNQLLDGNPHWEPQNALRVIYKGRAYTARFLVSDIANMIQDTPGFAAGRLGPLPKTAFETVTGRDMRTGARKEPLVNTSIPALRSAEIAVQDLAGWLAPVGSEGFVPGATGREQTKPGQVAMAMAGIGSKKYTPENQMMDAAAKFNRSASNAKANLYQQTRDNEAGNPSQYRKLDDLIDAGDVDGAKKEYQALIAEGHAPQSVLKRYEGVYRPFSGNAQREVDFKRSLAPADLATYNQAIADRRARLAQFQKIRGAATAAAR